MESIELPACHFISLHVQRSGEDDVPTNHFSCFLHLLIQVHITNEPCSAHDFPARLVETGDDSNDCALISFSSQSEARLTLVTYLHYICQIGNSVERHPSGPLVDNLMDRQQSKILALRLKGTHLHQTEPWSADEVIGVLT